MRRESAVGERGMQRREGGLNSYRMSLIRAVLHSQEVKAGFLAQGYIGN